MIVYCFHDRFSWGTELAASIQKRKGSSQMISHAVQVPDEAGSYAFIHISDIERAYTKELAEDIGKKQNVRMIPSLQECLLHDELAQQYSEFGAWMPSTFLFRSIEDATASINELPYPIISYSSSRSHKNMRVLNDASEAYLEAAEAFNTANGIALVGGGFQRGYVFWQPQVNRQGVVWHVFMLCRKYAVVTQVPSGSDPSNPQCQIVTVEVMHEVFAEVLKYAYAFCAEHDFKWASVAVIPGHDPVREIRSPFVASVNASWPMWWFEHGGMIFQTEDGLAWESTGIPAVKIFDVVAECIIEGRFNG